MIASIPKLALELGLDFTDYENIAKNIKRISLIPKDKRQKIWFSLMILVNKNYKSGRLGRIWPICYRTTSQFLKGGSICPNKNADHAASWPYSLASSTSLPFVLLMRRSTRPFI